MTNHILQDAPAGSNAGTPVKATQPLIPQSGDDLTMPPAKSGGHPMTLAQASRYASFHPEDIEQALARGELASLDRSELEQWERSRQYTCTNGQVYTQGQHYIGLPYRVACIPQAALQAIARDFAVYGTFPYTAPDAITEARRLLAKAAKREKAGDPAYLETVQCAIAVLLSGLESALVPLPAEEGAGADPAQE